MNQQITIALISGTVGFLSSIITAILVYWLTGVRLRKQWEREDKLRKDDLIRIARQKEEETRQEEQKQKRKEIRSKLLQPGDPKEESEKMSKVIWTSAVTPNEIELRKWFLQSEMDTPARLDNISRTLTAITSIFLAIFLIGQITNSSLFSQIGINHYLIISSTIFLFLALITSLVSVQVQPRIFNTELIRYEGQNTMGFSYEDLKKTSKIKRRLTNSSISTFGIAIILIVCAIFL